MGVCCGANEGKNKHNSEHRKNGEMKQLEKADPNASHQIDVKDIDSRVKVLGRGIEPELEHMINNYDEEINAYIFGQNKTLLLQAVITCPNPKVVDMIMKKGANVDMIELQTGNTALFLSAVDLKVEFVRELMKYHPNLSHRNNLNQDIFEFLQFQLYDQRRSMCRELTADEKQKYDKIIQILRDSKDVEKLDD